KGAVERRARLVAAPRRRVDGRTHHAVDGRLPVCGLGFGALAPPHRNAAADLIDRVFPSATRGRLIFHGCATRNDSAAEDDKKTPSIHFHSMFVWLLLRSLNSIASSVPFGIFGRKLALSNRDSYAASPSS